MHKSVSFTELTIDGGFWQERQALNRQVTVGAVMRQFQNTGRFDALCCDWREGQPNKPHIFYDSDIAKWIESVAYLIETGAVEPEIRRVAEEAIEQLILHQHPDGYMNSFFTGIAPAKRWQDRLAHELYCAGHLMEAAVAWHRATGDKRFLSAMCRCADRIDEVFVREQSAAFSTPGHEEIELALIRLYHATGEERYLALSRHFVEARGNNPKDQISPERLAYSQSHLPVREQTTAEGHAVRACYLYSGMADIAMACGDDTLRAACEKLFDNIVSRRMYITGGVGSSHIHEAFTTDYHLPNETAYNETCAAISLIYFAERMLLLTGESRYADAIERILYNGFLSGTSLSGKEFFYTNPLEINLIRHAVQKGKDERDWLPAPQRVEVFNCSCCPPNITRLIASLGDYIYTRKEGRVYIQQYISNTLHINQGVLSIRTDFPASGVIALSAKGMAGQELCLRIPGWCDHFTLNTPYYMESGYAVVTLDEENDIVLTLSMTPVMMEADPRVLDDAGKAAVMRGPVVYCMEGVDNGGGLGALFIEPETDFREEHTPMYCAPALHVCGHRLVFDSEADCLERNPVSASETLYRPAKRQWQMCSLRLIPYYAFANRGESDMRVWIPVRM